MLGHWWDRGTVQQHISIIVWDMVVIILVIGNRGYDIQIRKRRCRTRNRDLQLRVGLGIVIIRRAVL